MVMKCNLFHGTMKCVEEKPSKYRYCIIHAGFFKDPLYKSDRQLLEEVHAMLTKLTEPKDKIVFNNPPPKLLSEVFANRCDHEGICKEKH